MRRPTLTRAVIAALISCPPLAAWAGDDRAAWLDRVDRARREYEAFASRAVDSYAARNGLPTRNSAPAPRNFAEDVTLREGDIVMTNEGLRVYAGSGLKTLEAWRGDDRRREDLLELQKASLRENSR